MLHTLAICKVQDIINQVVKVSFGEHALGEPSDKEGEESSILYLFGHSCGFRGPEATACILE